MGRNGYGPKWSWAEMIMGRNDPESIKDHTLIKAVMFQIVNLKYPYWFCLLFY